MTPGIVKLPKSASPLLVIIKDIFPEKLKGQILKQLAFSYVVAVWARQCLKHNFHAI